MKQLKLQDYALVGYTSALVLVCTGCVQRMSLLAQQTHAFSSAAVLVADGSEDAYASANRLHYNEQIALAILDYDKSPSWDPENFVKPLLSDEQLDARQQVLRGLKTYAESLGSLASPKATSDLSVATKDIGINLQQLSTTVNTTFEIGSKVSISDTEKNLLSTALMALGTFLQRRVVERQLPSVLQTNDKTIGDLCDVLISDVKVLRRQSDKDYGALEIAQDQYIRHAEPALSSDERRVEIAKLPVMVREQQQNDLLLSKLQKALGGLKSTHNALAAAAQTKDTLSLQQHIAEFMAEGQSLASYYQSLEKK